VIIWINLDSTIPKYYGWKIMEIPPHQIIYKLNIELDTLPKLIMEILKPPGPVAEKPSESGNNTHFQRQSCPGPDFKAENGKYAIFSLKGL
jgi:hypothetical protein